MIPTNGAVKEENKVNRGGTKSRFWILSEKVLLAGFGCFLVGFHAVGFLLFYFSFNLPSFASIADYKPIQVTRMLDRKGRVVAEFFDEKRTVVDMGRIPEHVRQAFLAAEDAQFYKHPGLDFPGMLRALLHNLRAGRVVEGGSTITQQVIKTFIVGPERSYSRKIRELLLALRLESNLTKDEILSLYLNQIFFGHQCYGIQEASRFFFGKDVGELSLAEGALLAALPKSPSLYSPIRHPDRALERRNWVIDQMLRQGLTSSADIEKAKSMKMEVSGNSVDFWKLAPYYAEHCRRQLEEKLGRERVYRGGLVVDLAVDLDIQQAAQESILNGLRQIDKRQGFRGPLGHLSGEQIEQFHQRRSSSTPEKAVWTVLPKELKEGENQQDAERWRVQWLNPQEGIFLAVPVVAIDGTGKQAIAKLDLGNQQSTLSIQQIGWARKFSPIAPTPSPASVTEILSVGDIVEVQITKIRDNQVEVSLEQDPLIPGALVAIEVNSRNVLALVGGSDFKKTPLIRAIQSKRQPGSAFKPIVYAAAIHTGAYTPVTILMDTPEVFYTSLKGSTWRPKNFERVFVGPVPLRTALAHSINSVAIKIAADIGLDSVVAMAHLLGIKSELEENLSLALGTSELTLIELVNSYTTFAAQGMVAEPVFINGVKTPDGQNLDLFERPEPKAAISEAEAYVMTSLLESVVQEGTGKSALTLGRPLAGKTGTATEHRDGWFVGYSPELAAGVWIGFDDHAKIGTGWAQGAGTALPIWIRFMDRALQKQPKTNFKPSAGVVFAWIDPKNGLLASSKFPEARAEVFVDGTEPRAVSERIGDGKGEIITNDPANPPIFSGEKLPEGLYK